MYKPRYFKTQELVPEFVYEQLGEQSLLLFDKHLLITIDSIRSHFNKPVIVNNWLRHGKYHERGFRLQHTSTGSQNSMHKQGRAIDFKVKGVSSEDVRKLILTHRELFPYITRMEKNVSWVHIDNSNTGRKGIKLF